MLYLMEEGHAENDYRLCRHRPYRRGDCIVCPLRPRQVTAVTGRSARKRRNTSLACVQQAFARHVLQGIVWTAGSHDRFRSDLKSHDSDMSYG